MKTAILAWGSLVWDPRDCKQAAEFAPDGPLLPIEFCRISGGRRLTLALDETYGAVCKTYSAQSAIQSWTRRSRTSECGKGCRTGAQSAMSRSPPAEQSDVAMQRHPEAVAAIAAWTASKGYDAAIWTALASNFDEPDKGVRAFLRHGGAQLS